MKTKEQIREGYSSYPTHILEHVVRYNTTSCNAAASKGVQNAIIDEKRMVAEVATDILRERQG